MRKRRTDAKTRVAIRAFLAGETGAVETCQFLSLELYRDPELADRSDTLFIREVADQVSETMLKREWHPQFAAPKLKQLQQYEEQVKDHLKQICEQILLTFEKRKKDAETNENS